MASDAHDIVKHLRAVGTEAYFVLVEQNSEMVFSEWKDEILPQDQTPR